MKIIRRIFVTLSLLLLLCGCEIENGPDGKSNSDLATEVAQVSTAIQSTIQSAWTATLVPTTAPSNTPTFAPVKPSATPTSDFLLTDTAADSYTVADEEISVTPDVLNSGERPTHIPSKTPEPGSPTPDNRPLASTWRDWPVLPVISDNSVDIYWYGVNDLGTNPHYVSKIGDCHSEPNVFLGIYDTDYYELSKGNQYMTAAIDYFRGSFSQASYAVHNGMSVASVLTSAWADPNICQSGESALDCEIRVHNPSIMFVNLGSNWIAGLDMEIYYEYLSEIIQTLLDHGILPILSSKADNAEGGYKINEITAQAARDFDIPYFNFWPIAQNLKNKGLDPEKDGIHLSVEAWNWRNFYALKTLYVLGQALGIY